MVFDDLATDPRFAPWRADVLAMGAASIASFPLIYRAKIFGVLTVKQNRVRAFDEEEIRLLAELATDIAHAWSGLEEAAAHGRTRETLETLVAAIPDAVFFKDGEGRWQIVNSGAKRLFQLEARPWLGRTDLEMAGDLPALKAAHEACHSTDETAWAAGGMSVVEEHISAPDGTVRDLQVYKVPLFHDDGRRKGLVIVGRDVTELREASARLAQANAELEQRVAERTHQLTEATRQIEKIFDCSPVAVAITRREDGLLIHFNQAWIQATGFTRDEMLHRTVLELNLHESNRHRARLLEILDREGGLRNHEYRYRKKSGEMIDIVLSVEPIEIDGTRCLLSNLIDITERKRAERVMERSAREIEDLYNRAPCGYHSLDEQGLVLQMNDTELKWLGYDRHEVIGHDIREFCSPPGRRTFEESFPELKRQGRLFNLDMEFLRKDGSPLPTVINSAVMPDDEGHFVRTQTTVFDNTERLKADQNLRKALAEAAAASRAKSEFLANMSHEIRTPMNAIMGYAQILQRDKTLPQTIRGQIEIISRNSQALLSLLNGILELSKIEVGRTSVKASVFSPVELCHDLLGLFQERATTKRLALTLLTTPNLPQFVEADQDKIRQAAANLLSNAIKFTTVGGVQFSVSATPSSPSQWLLAIEVKDTGPGIPAEEMAQLFQKFGQTSTGLGAPSASGLGLYLSREHARLMGGDLTVQSQPGIGSCFRLEVPVKAAAPSPATLAQPELPVLWLAPGASADRILIADDLADNRDVLRLVLEHIGFDVQTAADGWEALRVCKQWHPQLILMDAWMPGMDGYETIRRLRDNATGMAPKILMISASAFEEDRRAALAAGANDFVPKPFCNEELLEKIQAQLGCQYAPRPAMAAPASISATPAELSPETLGRLPGELRRSLREALLVGDFDRVFPLLDEVSKLDSGLAAGLLSLAAQFDAQAILRLLPE